MFTELDVRPVVRRNASCSCSDEVLHRREGQGQQKKGRQPPGFLGEKPRVMGCGGDGDSERSLSTR